MKTLGFLSFGHYQPVPGSHTRTAREALTQTIELAVVAEEIGIGMAAVRVHHFARQASTPIPLLAAIAARTQRIEIGTAVIDMRYENPYAMAEQAAAADLISGGRLQLGLSRGSQEVALRGYEAFGHVPAKAMTDADMARLHTAEFRRAIAGDPIASTDPAAGPSIGLPVEPRSPGLTERIWWGSSTRASAVWTAEQGMNLMSSTLLSEDTGTPFDEQQREQIDTYRETWRSAGHQGTPRVSVARSVLPITSDEDRLYFGDGNGSNDRDQVGILNGAVSRFGRSYIGEPDVIAKELAADAAVAAADTLLLTIPNQLGVDYNARLLQTIVDHVAPHLR
ncbi:LLM class flavin-dependent oxidoreductase [Actinacidiphila oryziradicis]|uniref:LLM class flavin-dependent oxidoreductase n=1 Tax=Actinacidiphila oryziradicis TaxID=2571141 RepID=A0A4U0RS97_9ACTN|nr:LLM class flavin-dependent oxidoreductase [Actinacidiphila oryziradicis]TJZ98929.1 LLM class flavin-dependent oxidoreductase [Actinacidiphila oryziradicis]